MPYTSMPSFKITRQFKILLLILFAISVASFTVAYFYYQAKNRAEDPRIAEARFMLQQYDDLMAETKYSDVFPLLDSIEAIFSKVPVYGNSFEPGIVYNNRGSAFLSMALYEVKDSVEKQQLLGFAQKNLDTCIQIYKGWIEKFSDLSREELMAKVSPFYSADDPAFQGKDAETILNKRVDNLLLAQKETPRRLSVAYTNRGIIQRHQYRQTEAMESYITAIKLWKDNFTARNNFNVLMGIDPEDRSIVDQLFPPDKNK
jgi:tetratricopeptide (TPR) repeat protein